MKRKLILPLVLVALALGIGLKLAANKEKLDAAKQPVDRSAFAFPVNVITVEEQSVDAAFSVPGTLEPYDRAKVMVQAQGKLASLGVDLGSRVAKGQVLGSLDVAGKQLELQAAELQLGKLRKDELRYRELLAGKATPRSTYDDIKFNFETQQVKVEQIRQQLRDAQVVSPVNGTVVAKNVEVGEFVGAGTAVVEVVDVSRLKAKVYVSEHAAYRLREGSSAAITSTVYPGTTFEGKVTFVSPQGDANHNYRVEVAVENNKEHALKSGTFVNVRFEGSGSVPMLSIPKGALAEGVKDPYVYVVNAEGTSVQRRNLVLGREAGEQVEVLQGLKPGESVVVTGQLNLVEGSTVRVANSK
ncbi:MAG: efflux RND transporter periplasmic adaptor subunit [Flavobacteriales bacterium]|nr:efflux RND transporter periplasmic adaptor subunit [Flavobacteriales bacterium]